MIEFDNDFDLLDSLINTQKINDDNMCKLCCKPFEKVCKECGFCYDLNEFVISDMYTYVKIQKIYYQKITHFKEVLCNFQAKECKFIPNEILELILTSVNHDKELINISIIKNILKRNKLTKYVENVHSLLFILTGTEAPFIPREIELKLIQYFKQITKIFDICKTPNRVNFLNYYFILYKLLELIGETDIMLKVPKIKCKHRILEHNKMWKQICLQLEWKFIKTIKC